ncbi:MAG TPA: ferredoxin [Acidimicrobiales bacterium]|nr:ferredoxin [Acidimicrobiales bacterium]
MALEVIVHHARCIGSKVCLSAAPGVFHIDYDNTAMVIDPEAASEAELLQAVRTCPTGAITVIKDGHEVA